MKPITSPSFPKSANVIDFIGKTLKEKRTLLRKYIKSELPELLEEWEVINGEIGVLNLERRYLVHGIGRAYLFHENISTYVKVGKTVQTKEYKVKDIKSLTNRIGHVNTGKNGINGVFYFKFKTAIIDSYNERVENSEKIVFKLNGEIVSKWKG